MNTNHPKILLLDCSAQISEKLRKLGFDVESGELGYFGGKRRLPSQIYEKEVFIYNPSYSELGEGFFWENDIEDTTPEYEFKGIFEHISRGAVVFTFINEINKDMDIVREFYNWIPNIPTIEATKDHLLDISPFVGDLGPLVLPGELKKPVLRKLYPGQYNRYESLYVNKKGEMLGGYKSMGNGLLIVLPEYQDNDFIITQFATKILPKIFEYEESSNLKEEYTSPDEAHSVEKITELEQQIKDLGQELETERSVLHEKYRLKVQKIQGDDTSVLILNYYDLAVNQKDVSLFYLYKIVEALENKYQSESAAIAALNAGTEIKYISKIANASYGDVRHAPKLGDVVKKWTDEEIELCYDYAKKLIFKYFDLIFANKD